MSEEDILFRAKTLQRYCTSRTNITIRLAILEDLIAEIEQLRHRVDALSENHIRPVRERAEQRQGGKP